MYFEDVEKLTERQLIDQLRISSSPGAHDFELCARELERRYLLRVETAVTRLDDSSNRLERLTKALLWLTLVLAVLAVPPAFEVLARMLR